MNLPPLHASGAQALRSLASPSFFFNDTAPTEIYTLSLHDALPIRGGRSKGSPCEPFGPSCWPQDRKSTRLNSSHVEISYAVFCLKKKSLTPATGLGRRHL